MKINTNSDVYFVSVTDNSVGARIVALEKLLTNVGAHLNFKKDELVPVKLTIGDASCVHNMSPELVRAIILKIENSGAKPFMFDTGVIYHGSRQNAYDHLTLAYKKGFSQHDIGAPFIVADGVLGQDGREVEINSENIKKIKIPSFIGMMDSLVVLSHATGHIFTGYAGAIKNVAMGMSCRATKQVQHSSLRPSIIQDKCSACGCCVRICPAKAISFSAKEKAHIEPGVCIGCGECLCACKFDAVYVNWEEDMDVFCRRMVDVAHYILSQFKNKLFITFAFDITQECDCISTKDEKMISSNVGILASTDILSLDKAVSDLMQDASGFLSKHQAYKKMFEYGEKIGLGTQKYNLITSYGLKDKNVSF